MITNLYLLFKTLWIISSEYCFCLLDKNKDQCFINICKKLATINMFYVKMFQAISTDSNLLSENVQNYLTTFTDKVPFTSDDIDNSFKKTIEDHNLKLINPNPINSGVISLIYKVVDNNNNKYILKVKRKNIEQNMNESINAMAFIINILSKLPYFNSLNLINIFNENITTFKEQINFTNEVNNIKYFSKKNKNIDYVVIPNVLENITHDNNNIIVMTYLDGRTITEIPENEKNIYCELLAKFAVKCVFFDGVYHGDFHQGNILFMKEGGHKIGVIDYGIIGKLERQEQNNFYNFVSAFYKGEFVNAVDLFLENHVGPDNVKKNLSKKDIYYIKNNIANILERIIKVSKQATPNDMYEISNILYNYNLSIKRDFCKVQLAFMINETMCNALSTNISFIEYYGNMLENNFE